MEIRNEITMKNIIIVVIIFVIFVYLTPERSVNHRDEVERDVSDGDPSLTSLMNKSKNNINNDNN